LATVPGHWTVTWLPGGRMPTTERLLSAGWALLWVGLFMITN
jgi:hypothetical protein